MKKIHIGEEIKKVSKDTRIGATELAKRITKSRANVNDIFLRESIDAKLLLQVSIALKFDFFQLYTQEFELKTGITKNDSQESESDLKKKLEAQTKNAAMQLKYITLLEEKLETLQKAHPDKAVKPSRK